jgi:hypothetical protein
MEKDIFKDFSPEKAMDYDLGSAYGCPQGQTSSMCSNAKAGSKLLCTPCMRIDNRINRIFHRQTLCCC